MYRQSYTGSRPRSYSGYGNQQVNRKRFNRSTWSHLDLVKTIESASRAPKDVKVHEEYVPTHTFEDFQIATQLKYNIRDKNYTAPTPIQDQCIPAIISGKDLIGIANTGTGKTAAFLIPLIDKAFKKKTERVIIITPTRELAEQINEEFRCFAKSMGVYSALCIGGKNMYLQIKDLKRNPNFVIGTPGRIRDLIKQKVLFLNQFNNVVLDETDRMVDIGFIEEIKFFISLLPKERQSLFFSATIAPKVQSILRDFVYNPVTVSVKQQETAENVRQDVVHVSNGYKKVDQLHQLLIQEGFDKVLIFGNTKWGVQRLSDELVKRGFRAGAIHGDKRQNQRQQILNQFKRSEIQILLATDVASRGLDINDVSHVINYDLPESYDDYVHRIGRTGRANKKGVALTFIEG
jgi:ATP-dependent RNA helicase RhlE